MGTEAPFPRTAGLAGQLFLLLFALSVTLPSTARADYRTNQIQGDSFWLPRYLQERRSFVSLFGAPPRGLLKGINKNVRDTMEIDLEGGRVTVRRQYGPADPSSPLVIPEYVQDVRTATLAAAAKEAREAWAKEVRKRGLTPPAAVDAGLVSIDLPVKFPDQVADIIGQGARLNLSGSERVTFSGTSTIIEGGPTFESGNPSAFPDLDMNQHLRVNLDGTIGEKIHVLVNHDSEVDTDFENKIQLRYDGDEDEVVQKIEMGNTDLSLPGAEFLSFRKSQQGLFGAKALAKLGALDLTVIASKQEGETATQNFVGRARQDSLRIRDIDYVKRKYYWITPPESLALAPDSTILPIGDFELFLDDKDGSNDLGLPIGLGYADAVAGVAGDSTAVHRGFYHRLTENEDYQIDRQTGALTLERAVPRNQALAMFYVRADGREVGDITVPDSVGVEVDTLRLQLLGPPEQELWDDTKGFASLRVLEQKNVYFIGARNIVPESFEMVILRKGSSAGQQDKDTQADPDEPSAPETEFVKILGLDYKGITTSDPDLIVEPEFIDFEDGTITFPNLTPFAPDSSQVNVIVSPSEVSTGRTGETGVRLGDYNSAIYTLEPNDLFGQDKYYLEVQYTTPTPTYSLNRFNILEGSERVRLNGRQLTRGTDYDIDYEFGIVTFRTADASQADAEIEVDFEYVPLFGQAKESLVGVSGTYNFSPQTRLSSSWLFFTRATPEERPRLGQEPSRILVGNLYGQWLGNPSFMTGLVNALPLVRSEDQSELQVQGEVALSIPNPNTKDQIYVDDMEGVEDSRELSITRGLWVPASEPAGPSDLDLDKATDRVRPLPSNWYNPENVVRRKEVFPELADEREGQDFLQVLEFSVREGVPSDTTGWMGVMRNLSQTGEDFSEKKFLEVWVNDFGRRRGRLIFDLGEISEDFYVRENPDQPLKGRGFLDTEDIEPIGGDGQLTVSREDFGLDNVKGRDGDSVPGDDGDDDFQFSRPEDPTRYQEYTKINSYEGNSLLDTEDLDEDRLLDTDNAYLSYVFDLSASAGDSTLAQDNGNGWRLYRIRLDAGASVGGLPPRLRSIKYARIWFDDLEPGPGRKAQIAQVKIVGSAWVEERQSRNDTVVPFEVDDEVGFLGVDVKNNKEDVDYFPPFDPGEDQNNEQKREQALVLEYWDIPSAGAPGDTMGGRQNSAYKEILDTGQGRSQDYTQYETMDFYLRDGSPDRSSQGSFFLRFGPDTTNFYEFTTRELSEAAGGWREISIRLNDLAELKLDPAETTRTVEGVPVDYRYTVDGADTLAVYGLPSLTRVRRMTLGIRGDDPSTPTIRGEIWVDEIRLRRVKKDIGYASRISGSARFADLLNVSGGGKLVDSEFRRIEGNRHGNDERSWNVRGDIKLNKFFDGRGISLPLSGDYSYSETTPLLAPNSDIELEDEEDKAEARSTSRRQSVSSRFAKTRPSRNALLRYSIDNLSFGGSNTRGRNRTPFQTSRTENTSGQASYNLNPGQGKTWRLLKRFDISYLPTVKLGVNGSLATTESADIRENDTGERVEQPRAPVRTRSLLGTMGVQWDPVRSNTFDSSFSFNKRQDFDRHPEEALWESFKRGGRELQRDHVTRLSYRPGFFRWLRPVVSYDTNYQEDQGPSVQPPDLQSRPEAQGGPIRVFRVQNSNSRDFTTTLSLRQLLPKRRETGARGTAPASRARSSRQGRSWRDDLPPEPERDEDEEPEAEKPESEEEGGEEGEEPKGPDFGRIYDGLTSLVHTIGDIRYSYSDRRSSRYSRVSDRPDLAYQFGLTGFDLDVIVPFAGAGASNLIEDNTEDAYSTKLDTSFEPTSTIYLDGSYSRNISKKTLRGTRNKTEDLTFPDISVTIEGLEDRLFLRRWTKSSSLNSAYRRQRRRSGKLPVPGAAVDSTANWYDTENVRKEFSPLLSWSTNWKSGLNTTVSLNRSTTVDESDFRSVLSSTETTSTGWRVNGRYSFSAPKGITILGRRLRFKSDLTLNFDVNGSEAKSVESSIPETGSVTTTVRSHQKSLGIEPRATYNFSRKIQGSVNFSYRRNQDLQRDRTDKTISLAFEAILKF